MVTMRKDCFGGINGEFVIKIMKGPVCNFGNLTSLPNIMQAFIIFFGENADQEFGYSQTLSQGPYWKTIDK